MGEDEKIQEDLRVFIEQLGRRMKAERKSLGFTQQDVADILGIARSSIVYMEHGEHPPRIPTLFKLAALYNIDFRTFFSFLDERDE